MPGFSAFAGTGNPGKTMLGWDLSLAPPAAARGNTVKQRPERDDSFDNSLRK